MKILRIWRPQANIFVFVLLLAAGNLALYQKPLLDYGISVSALPEQAGWLQIFSLQFVQYCLMASVFFLVATLSITALRVLASLFAWINANALHFMLTYNMELDRTMIANILGTDNREQTLLPDAIFADKAPTGKEVVVLVIGEAARAESFSYYGYAKETNAFTRGTSIIALPLGLSCATNTISSTACILTHEGSAASSRTKYETLPSYLTRSGVETIYRTNNTGPPPVTVTTYERASEIAARCIVSPCPHPNLDEALNWELADVLNASTSKRIFVTIHQSGSHGPAYYSKYPEGFSHFKPECKTVQVSSCSQEELFNAYDNSIRYTDFLLADLIAQLETVNADTVMIYVSDHGQSLGENGFYLHGAPNSIAPKQQREIPFLVWLSMGFKARKGITETEIVPAETFPHDFPFHSVMGAFGMKSGIYKPEFDVFDIKP